MTTTTTPTATATATLSHYIGGEWLAGGGPAAESTNPVQPDDVVAHYATADRDQLD